MRIFDAGRLLELGVSLGLSRDQLWARAKRRDVPRDSARFVQLESVSLLYSTERKIDAHKRKPHMNKKGEVTHGYVRYLAKRLVLEVRRLLMLCRLKVNGNDLVWDVAFFGYQGHAARAGGQRGSVKFEGHGVKLLYHRYGCSVVRVWNDGSCSSISSTFMPAWSRLFCTSPHRLLIGIATA